MADEFRATDQSPPLDPAHLTDLIQDLRRRWKDGERPLVESYVESMSLHDPTYIRDLVFAEYRAAIEAGLDVRPSAYLERFPNHQEMLSRLFSIENDFADGSLAETEELDRLPHAGAAIGPYKLVRVLGEGAFARVFLAKHTELEDRFVVLKVSRVHSNEPRLLARLQHNHIVEVVRHTQTEDKQLEIISMPFLGGATLSTILASVRKSGKRPRSGRNLIQHLVAVSAPEFPAGTIGSSSIEKLSGLSYAKALAWIVARLAEALDFAHENEVTHGDVKPSNILISSAGVPLLFDFNVGVDLRHDNATLSDGGTLGYLPPDRLKALLPNSAQGEAGAAAEYAHQADLYALGLVLLEAISGIAPAVEPDPMLGIYPVIGDLAEARMKGPGAFAKALARTPSSLQPILRHVLQADPRRRYQRGNQLAADLDRWVSDLPPLGTRVLPNPGQFARRNRRKLGILGIVIATALSLLFLAILGIAPESRKRTNVILDDSWSTVSTFKLRPVTVNDLETLPVPQSLRDGPRIRGWRSQIDYLLLTRAEQDDFDAFVFGAIFTRCLDLADLSQSTHSAALDLLDQVISIQELPALTDFRDELLSKQDTAPASPEWEVEPVRNRSDDAWLNDYLVAIRLLRNHARAASVKFAELVREKPHLVWARFGLGVAYDRLGLVQAAKDRFAQCVDARPNHLVFRLRYASGLLRMRDLAGAEEQLLKAQALGRFSREGQSLSMFLADAQRKPDQLRARIDEYLGLVGSAKSESAKKKWRVFFGARGQETGKSADELAAVEEVLRGFPDDRYFLMKEAELLFARGAITQSIQRYDHLLANDPDDLLARFNRGKLLHTFRPNDPMVFDDFRQLLIHPRFEELIALAPDANRLPQQFSYMCLARNDQGMALFVTSLGCRVAVDRGSNIAEAHFGLARVLAVMATVDAEVVPLVIQELLTAEGYKPGILRMWLDRDVYFEPIRSHLFVLHP